jgi:hypothetical protein
MFSQSFRQKVFDQICYFLWWLLGLT